MSEGEPLVRIPGSTLYQVDHASHAVTTISNGDFLVGYNAPGDDARLEAQVGPVRWPLSHGTASLRFDDHTYAFELRPPPGAPPPPGSSYYCVTLPPDTPLELLDLLQAVLASGSAYHDQQHLVPQPQPQQPATAVGPEPLQPAPEPLTQAQQRREQPQQAAAAGRSADRIAEGLQRGGQMAAAGVLAAAMMAGAALHKGAEAVVARTQPAERPANVSPHTQARIEKAKVVASQVAAVTGRAVGGALSVTAQVAGALAHTIASSELGRSLGRSRIAGASAQDLRKVGCAGVEAVEAVYDSLADAARIVLAHTHTAATRVVGHKYGADAALATGAGIQVAQSAVETGLNVYKLRPTALVKKVIKGTAQNVVLGSRAAASAGGQQSQHEGAVLQLQPLQPAAAPLRPQLAPQPLPLQAQHQRQPPQQQSQGPHTLAPQGLPPAATPAPPPPPPVAAASTLAAVTGAQGAGGAGTGAGTAMGGSTVDGVVVTGPVPAHPVLVDYTASAAVALGSGGASGSGAGGGLPYPAVSPVQYAARYYPAVPQA